MRKCLDELSQYHDFYHDDKKELTFEFHFKGKLTLFRHETLWKAFDSFFPQGQSQGFHFNGLLIRLALKTEIAYFWLWKKILRTLFTSDGNTSLGNLICKSQVNPDCQQIQFKILWDSWLEDHVLHPLKGKRFQKVKKISWISSWSKAWFE